MTVDEALSYIHSVSWMGTVPGLSRTQELLRRLGNPEKKTKYVHIAGTNGKGSTAAMTASILQQAGYKVGLYTSPYINCFHERMQVNGKMITDEELVEATEEVMPHAEAMEDHPTEFELVSCIAFVYFAKQNCDVVVLEVGMGGELDSTNVIETPLVSVITNIGLDHTEVLGDTLEKIAGAKSGIIKGGHTVIYRASPSVEKVFEDKCASVGSQLHKADFDSIQLHSHGFEGQVFDACGYENIHLPLLGAHQMRNAAVVLTVISALQEQGYQISRQNVYDGMAKVSWPGRFELLRKDPLFLVDGGHNPQCIEALADNIRDYLAGRPLTVLTGVLADKDYNCMYARVAQYAREFVTVTPGSPRAMSAEDLKAYLSQFGKPITACDTVSQGVLTAIEKAGKDGVVLAYGSLYMVGDIRQTVADTLK